MRKNKKQRRVMLLLILILSITIGFALLSTTLFINGTANIKSNTWNIHWDSDSIEETTGSVSATTPASVTDAEEKNISFAVEFELPGDFYEFSANAINEGSIDGKIETISVKFYEADGTTEIDKDDLPEEITYSLTHKDGTPIAENEVITQGGGIISYKFRIGYNSETTSLPTEPIVVKPNIEITPVQHKSENVKYNLGDLVYFDPISEDKCDSTTFDVSKINNNESTCYKWRVITINDTKSEEKIELQLDHNLGGTFSWGSNNTNIGPVSSFGGPFNSFTSGWIRVPLLNYTYDTSGTKMGYDYGTLSSNVYAGDDSPSKNWSRISKRTDTDYYSPSNNDSYYFSNNGSLIGTTLSWLIENTYQTNSSGATDNVYGSNVNGYWTLTPLDEFQDSVWRVSYEGLLYYTSSTTSNVNGMRPVINIEKSKITK